MKEPYYHDQFHIAELFAIVEDNTSWLASLAFYKIYTYKLSLKNNTFPISRKDLEELIYTSLLNYVHPCTVLQMTDFYNEMKEN